MSFANGEAVLKAPPLSSWSWLNQSSSVATTVSNNAINIYTPKFGSSSSNLVAYYRAVPGSTPYHVVAKISDNPVDKSGGSANYGTGFGFTDGGNMVVIQKNYNVSFSAGLAVNYWSGTSGSPTVLYSALNPSSYYAKEISWFMIRDDGTNIYFYSSSDGMNWVQAYSETRNTHVSMAFANICIANNNEGVTDYNATLLSYNLINL